MKINICIYVCVYVRLFACVFVYYYREGLGGVKKDGQKALEYCQKALEVAGSYYDAAHAYKRK